MQTYYLYDKNTNQYEGSINTMLIQPDNSTTVAPVVELNGVQYPLDNAVYQPETKTWTGDNASYQTQKQVALLTQMVMAQGQQIAALTKQTTK